MELGVCRVKLWKWSALNGPVVAACTLFIYDVHTLKCPSTHVLNGYSNRIRLWPRFIMCFMLGLWQKSKYCIITRSCYSPQHAYLALRHLGSWRHSLTRRCHLVMNCQGEYLWPKLTWHVASQGLEKCEKAPIRAAPAQKKSSKRHCAVFGCENNQRKRKISLRSVCVDNDKTQK